MKTVTAVFMIGLGAGLIASAVAVRQAQAKLIETNKMSQTEYRLRTQLISWLSTAPERGYTAEEIARYYNEQVAFIELAKANPIPS
jgi:hypothetical protein